MTIYLVVVLSVLVVALTIAGVVALRHLRYQTKQAIFWSKRHHHLHWAATRLYEAGHWQLMMPPNITTTVQSEYWVVLRNALHREPGNAPPSVNIQAKNRTKPPLDTVRKELDRIKRPNKPTEGES